MIYNRTRLLCTKRVNEIPFDAHLELLCDCSPYFDSLYSDRTENPIPSDSVCFPDDDPDVFAELLGKLEICGLQNHVIQLCRAELDKKPGGIFDCDKIDYVYTHTLPESPLRLLLVDNWVQNANQARFESRQARLPRIFLQDLCCALIERKESTNRAEGDTDSAERYYVKPSPPRAIHGKLPPQDRDYPETVQTATLEQLKNRKFKCPSSRVNRSPMPSPPHVMPPIAMEKENDPKSELARRLNHLQIL
ncbi:BTB/POZ domain-containing protein [Aspergillus homomorphus CBS 101889]|uniref:BTB domain-containing protein n=1 Tax=Aspergillus homomorphus (strain CBS 101889) TaxID=1450537 RepID=A0A395HKK6_ASPHC|nr:hypothetical protein BO97DRAFT_438913 [Aspergillus homomorphus CBS 101889]RAL06794.1 hypothetical protein BO97DRAFT_438913 [Aspergillus homomorphus CBS 101889]